jgi:hypothetical protein
MGRALDGNEAFSGKISKYTKIWKKTVRYMPYQYLVMLCNPSSPVSENNIHL